jgi:hypothetical protein
VLDRAVLRAVLDRVVVLRAVVAGRDAVGLLAVVRLGLALPAVAARVALDRAVPGLLAVPRLGAVLLAVVLLAVVARLALVRPLLRPLVVLLLVVLLLAVLRLEAPRAVPPLDPRFPVARVRLLPAAGLPGVSAMSLSLPQDLPGWDRRHGRTTGGRRSYRTHHDPRPPDSRHPRRMTTRRRPGSEPAAKRALATGYRRPAHVPTDRGVCPHR